MGYQPGSTFYAEFVTQNPSTGAVQDADALPTATLTRNGADQNVALTVVRLGTGRYTVVGTVPNNYAGGDSVQVSVAASVGGTAGGGVVLQSVLDAPAASASPSAAGSSGGGAVVTYGGAGATLPDLGAQIGTAAQGPQAVAGDAGSVTQQPLAALVAADQYLAQKGAASKKGRGLRFTRLIGPPQCPVRPAYPPQDPAGGCA